MKLSFVHFHTHTHTQSHIGRLHNCRIYFVLDTLFHYSFTIYQHMYMCMYIYLQRVSVLLLQFIFCCLLPYSRPLPLTFVPVLNFFHFLIFFLLSPPAFAFAFSYSYALPSKLFIYIYTNICKCVFICMYCHRIFSGYDLCRSLKFSLNYVVVLKYIHTRCVRMEPPVFLVSWGLKRMACVGQKGMFMTLFMYK